MFKDHFNILLANARVQGEHPLCTGSKWTGMLGGPSGLPHHEDGSRPWQTHQPDTPTCVRLSMASLELRPQPPNFPEPLESAQWMAI